MRVVVLPKGEEKEFPGQRRVADVLKALDIIPETVLVAKGSTLVTPDETVEADAVLRIIPVISGGHNSEVCEVPRQGGCARPATQLSLLSAMFP